MNNWGKDKPDPTDNITPVVWKKHFKELLYEKDISTTNSKLNNYFNTFEPLLDGVITKEELKDSLKQLKGGKAPGPDGILAEYLQAFGHVAEDTLLKLIKVMFSNHIYPSKWTRNFIKPIYKKHDITIPDNYRGLAIGSVFAKLFSFILLNRLNRYIEEKEIISANQIGFMKGSRTSDHIFLIKTIVEKVVKKGHKKNLFCAFIDFKKAYDTVNRSMLLNRLKELGINGLLYTNIVAMYQKTEYIIKYKNGYLDAIDSNLGLKQGCPLSPMLFNIYIDDIGDIFDNQCEPVIMLGKNINHFMYADDLILLSLSKEGLQRCLNKLQDFSNRKHMTISVEKSKTMIFNKTGKLIKHIFTVNGEKLEPVQTFCYLGFDIKASGTVNYAINTLYDKANKAMRPILRAITRFQIPAKTSIKLFQTLISPIMLYNVENWATLSDKRLNNFTTDTIFKEMSDTKSNILHRKFIKFILGVTKSCPTLAIMGEVGETPLMIKGYILMLKYWHR